MELGQFPEGRQAITLEPYMKEPEQRQIAAWLIANKLPTLPEAWSWTWRVGKGPYQGTFPKRVSKYLFAVHKITLTKAQLCELGTLVSRLCGDGTDGICYLDFTRNFWSWAAGDFGDSNSCFWSFNSIARDHIYANGGWAIRFWNENYTKGLARAFLLPLFGGWLAFNTTSEEYGDRRYSLDMIGRVLSQLWDTPWMKVRAQNDGTTRRTTYVNGESAVIVAPELRWEARTKLTFELTPAPTLYCRACGKELRRGDTYHPDPEDSRPYCVECGRASKVCKCGQRFHKQEVTEALRGQNLCPKCVVVPVAEVPVPVAEVPVPEVVKPVRKRRVKKVEEVHG